MQRYDLKDMSDLKSIKQNISSSLQQKEKEKAYKQKVRSYTTYEIGRKLNEKIQPFSKKQIQMGSIHLNNSALMRVVTKWCQQLQKYFSNDYVLKRQLPFRMKDGSMNYLSIPQLEVLNYLLKKQWTEIKKKIAHIKSQNYRYQAQFIRDEIDPKLEKLSAEEVEVGSFSFKLFKMNQNYLMNYLNYLIHGLNSASLEFQKYQRVYLYYVGLNNTGYIIEQSLNWMQENIIQAQVTNIIVRQNLSENNYQLTPQLISFKLGDLMRCKCTSKQEEIIVLYKQIQRISKQNPDNMKIVRLKNRLDKGNKDILINITLRNVLLVEMQLCIKSDKSKFIQNSNKFNHYFYELERAEFGPLMQLCSIWMSQDNRANYYLNKMEQLNVRRKYRENKNQFIKNSQQNTIDLRDLQSNFEKEQNPKCECSSTQQISLSFRCSSCSCFYYDCNRGQGHSYCQKCKNYTCFLCQFQSLVQTRKQFLSTLQIKEDIKDIKFEHKQLPDKGIIVNLKAKKKKKIAFKTMLYDNQFYMFETKDNGNLQLVKKLASKTLTDQQLKQSLFITSASISKSIPVLSIQEVFKKYLAPNTFKLIAKSRASRYFFRARILIMIF